MVNLQKNSKDMFVKSIDEILEAFPTSVWNDPEKLIGLIEDEETALLQPILGDELMEKLLTRDNELREKYNRIDAGGFYEHLADEEDKDELRLLGFIRKALIFQMASNNVMNLSTSFNQGGGMNRMSTDGYQGENIQELKELAKEYWHSSQRAVENILHVLATDAQQKEPRYKAEWQSADWFYNHGDLLFPTVRSMKDYYDFDKDRRNIEYQRLVSTIRYCQHTYIAPVYGTELMTLLRNQIGKVADGEGDVLHTALSMTQQALGMFVAYKADKNAKREVLTTADQALANAIHYILDNKEAFGDALKKAQFFKEEGEDVGNGCCCANKRDGIDNWKTGFTKLF